MRASDQLIHFLVIECVQRAWIWSKITVAFRKGVQISIHKYRYECKQPYVCGQLVYAYTAL